MLNFRHVQFLGFVVVLLLVTSCTNGGTPTPASTPVGSSEGERLFLANGCAACHGSEGGGSIIAPGLTGRSANQVFRQARVPLGAMPIFSQSKISNAELEEIADYIESFGGEHAHVVRTDPNQASAQDHWMALFALEDNHPEQAIHHIESIIDEVTGPHQSKMKDVKAAVAEGNIHESIHVIKEMLAGVEMAGLSSVEINSSLARSSVLLGDIDDATHHVDHILNDSNEDSELSNRVAEIRKLLESEDFHDAAFKLQELADN